ncbi:MAG: hypothetical protein ACRDK9_01545 [Solirubrobacterales bacterium]
MSNHPTRESAEEAARIRANEERLSEEGGEPVVVDERHVHAVDDTRQGDEAGVPGARRAAARGRAADRDPVADRCPDRIRLLVPHPVSDPRF